MAVTAFLRWKKTEVRDENTAEYRMLTRLETIKETIKIATETTTTQTSHSKRNLYFAYIFSKWETRKTSPKN
ncbi:MAG: hypothetical protein H0Z28_04120 [Archaeoglobus sp.]|nr:hypothetical protein [Archaeoglobus sp.]